MIFRPFSWNRHNKWHWHSVFIFIISNIIAETRFLLVSGGHLWFFINGQRKKMETVFIFSVGIYRSEKSSSIKINMSMTQNFSMLHSDIYYNTAKLGRLTCFKSLRDIVNIAKIHRQYSWDVRSAGVVTKKKGFSSVLTLSKKKTNQHQTLHLDPQRAGFMINPNGITVMVARNCLYEHSEIHTYRVHISFKWRVGKDNIDLRSSSSSSSSSLSSSSFDSSIWLELVLMVTV